MTQRSSKTNKKVKVTQSNPEGDSSYFVSIASPLRLRRNMLEGSKYAILSLQNFEKILLLRSYKLKETERLKENFKELMFLNKQLDEKLPKYNTEILHATRKISSPKAMTRVSEVSEKSEMDRLENSLAAIEEKLRNLE